MEVEDIIKEIIDEEDEAAKQEQAHKEYLEGKKNKRNNFIKANQIALIIVTVLFLVTLVFPWYNLEGRGASEGFVRVPNNIIAKEYKNLTINEKIEYNGAYIKLSPINQLIYSNKYFNNYKTIVDNKGEERISIFSYLHIIYNYLYIVSIILSLIVLIIIILQKEFKLLKLIRWFSIGNILILIINYLTLKIPFFNMFTLYALKNLKLGNPNTIINMTQKGIAVENEFYHYGLSLKAPFFIAMASLIAGLGITFILNKIKEEK